MVTDAIPVATPSSPAWSISAPSHSLWPHLKHAGRVSSSSRGLAPSFSSARAPNLPRQLPSTELAPFFRLPAGIDRTLAAGNQPSEGQKPLSWMFPDARSGSGDQKAATVTGHTVRSGASDRQDRNDRILRFLASGCQKWAILQAWDRQMAGKGLVRVGRHTHTARYSME